MYQALPGTSQHHRQGSCIDHKHLPLWLFRLGDNSADSSQHYIYTFMVTETYVRLAL